MADKKLTDSAVIETFEKIIDILRKTEVVVLQKEPIDDLIFHIQRALDLINRLQAENERLKAKCENTQVGYNFLKADFEETEKRNRDLVCAFQSYKAEAYKEFAERLKEKYGYYDWKNKTIVYLEYEVDNLLKELVGEDK